MAYLTTGLRSSTEVALWSKYCRSEGPEGIFIQKDSHRRPALSSQDVNAEICGRKTLGFK